MVAAWLSSLMLPLIVSEAVLSGECPNEESHQEGSTDQLSMLQSDSRLLKAESDVHAADEKTNGANPGKATYFWSGKNGDAKRTGLSQFGLSSPVLKKPPTWSFYETAGNRLVRSAPLIDDNKNIYLATIPGHVYKFSPDGKQLWKYTDTVEIPGVPSLMDGKIFISTGDGRVLALDMGTGKIVWSTKIALHIAGDTYSMAAVDGIVISPCSDGNATGWDRWNNNVLVALNAASGAKMWAFSPDDLIYNILVSSANGAVIFADASGSAYKLSLSDGKLIWKTPSVYPGSFSTGGAVLGPDGVIYVTSNGNGVAMERADGGPGVVTALDFASGNVIWRRALTRPANNGVAVGPVYGSTELAIVLGVGLNPDEPPLPGQKPHAMLKKNTIGALHAKNGTLRWYFKLPDWYGAARGDVVMMPNATVKSHICLPDAFGNAAISGDGTVYIGNQNGLFYGIRDLNGDGKIDEAAGEAISYDAGNAFQGSPGLAPGMLIATPCNGMHVWTS